MITRPFGFAFGAWVAGRHHSTRSVKKLQIYGNGTLIAGSAFMVIGPITRSMLLIEVGLVVTGFANGYARTVIYALVADTVDTADIGITTGVLNMLSQIGSAAGTTIMSAVIADSYVGVDDGMGVRRGAVHRAVDRADGRALQQRAPSRCRMWSPSLTMRRRINSSSPPRRPGTMIAMSPSPLRVGVVLFERFELLDVFGPLEMFGVLPDRFEISLLGPQEGPVASSQGPRARADYAYADAPPCDIVLVPGGIGRLAVIEDRTISRIGSPATAPPRSTSRRCARGRLCWPPRACSTDIARHRTSARSDGFASKAHGSSGYPKLVGSSIATDGRRRVSRRASTCRWP